MLVVFAILLQVVCLQRSDPETLIRAIQSKTSLWTAGFSETFPTGVPPTHFATPEEIRSQETHLRRLVAENQHLNLSSIGKDRRRERRAPSSYDFRQSFPFCDFTAYDQGNCGSCWIVASSGLANARICRRFHELFGVEYPVRVSPQHILSCSGHSYCGGGLVENALSFIDDEGVVSEECFSYVGNENSPVGCPSACPDSTRMSFSQDRYHMRAWKRIYDIDEVKDSIFEDGPVVTSMKVYEDLYHYRSGIYEHVAGFAVNDHAVLVHGWGTENGVKFWIVQNSWGEHWGEDGFFRIVRSENMCGIEASVFGSLLFYRAAEASYDYCFPLCDRECRTWTTACSGHGLCSSGSCSCWGGFSGQWCASSPCDVCVHGVCDTETLSCVCHSGWSGIACDIASCGECVHGDCVSPDECHCDAGFTGATCDEKLCSYNCGDYGTCVSGECQCKIEFGYYGPSCILQLCHPECVHGVCLNNVNTTTNVNTTSCRCATGWRGPICSEAICDSECHYPNGVCSTPGQCTCGSDFTGSECEESIAKSSPLSNSDVVLAIGLGSSLGVAVVCLVVCVGVILLVWLRLHRQKKGKTGEIGGSNRSSSRSSGPAGRRRMTEGGKRQKQVVQRSRVRGSVSRRVERSDVV